MSDVYQSLAHSKWDCKYHVVFVPKRRRKVIFGHIRRQLGPILHALAKQKECQIVEGHLMSDHVHMMISIPPEYAVSQVVGFMKGKSAIHLARVYGERKRNFVGQHFWHEVFRLDGGKRREGDSRVHPKSRGGGQASRPAEPMAVTATVRWPVLEGTR